MLYFLRLNRKVVDLLCQTLDHPVEPLDAAAVGRVAEISRGPRGDLVVESVPVRTHVAVFIQRQL